jgi:bifunctional UDP-N-acetylglucosamine pyrophosphorylase/glucosamine-1-phosphate N-acetyltransferase
MTRTMIIPAAGIGSRLGLSVPKALALVAGRPMIDHLLALYGGTVNRFIVVASPSGRGLLEAHLRDRQEAIELAVQTEPTGMLDAVLVPYDIVRRQQPDRIWITWCDQVAVHTRTVARLLEAETAPSEPDLVMPTCQGADPYIHLERDASGRIAGVLQRREGDAMPPHGESDMGLFSMSRPAYLRDLVTYATAPDHGPSTRERNFLPFIPWLAATHRVVTFPCVDPIEAVGINTPEELRRIEDHLREAEARNADDDEPVSGTDV